MALINYTQAVIPQTLPAGDFEAYTVPTKLSHRFALQHFTINQHHQLPSKFQWFLVVQP